MNNRQQIDISRSSTVEAASNLLPPASKNDTLSCEGKSERRHTHTNYGRKPENFSKLAFQSKQ